MAPAASRGATVQLGLGINDLHVSLTTSTCDLC